MLKKQRQFVAGLRKFRRYLPLKLSPFVVHWFQIETIPAGEMGPVRFNIDVLNGGDQVNSLPDLATALVNVRTIPEYDNDQVTQKLTDLI
ncbi:hypothetical protein WP50_34820, partial [Lactiplantibacillus plantarum]